MAVANVRSPPPPPLVVREYDPKIDLAAVEEVENKCEVGPSGKLSLYTHLLGDPMSRLRHSPAALMLVAEIVAGQDNRRPEIVGMIRGCIKTVTCNTNHHSSNGRSYYTTKLSYILGLRVSPFHRRMGIGTKLVEKMEEWFRQNGAEYSYIATEADNRPSVNLFTQKCGYSKFRTPAILVHPVFAHRVKLDTRVTIIKLSATDAEALYRRRFSATEFFPRDIDAVLNNKLNLGTFLAVPTGSYDAVSWPGADRFLSTPRPGSSWAVLSVWNCMDVFRLEVRGASRVARILARFTRMVDAALPWLRLPSVPAVFRPFGVYFLYGLGGEGPEAARMMKCLCGMAQNLGREGGCGVVAAEVAGGEPLRIGIPHWRRLSCAEDVWCIKRLGEEHSDGSVGEWTNSPPGVSIFVDPREF